MLKVTSFKDFIPPDGLFPEDETEFLKLILKNIVAGVAHMPLGELNEFIEFATSIREGAMEFVNQSKVSSEIFNSIEGILNAPPSIQNSEPFYKLFELDTETPENTDTPDYLKASDLSLDYNLVIPLFSVYALQDFNKIVEKAKAIQLSDSIDDPYYRLGKVYVDLRGVDALMLLLKTMGQEILAIKDKEQNDAELQRQKAKKAGASSNKIKMFEKKKFLKQYIKDSEANPITNNSQYVADYLSQLDEKSKKSFSKGNINRYFLDAIRDYKSGKYNDNFIFSS